MESYSALLFEQIIRVDSRLQNAQWENRPVLDYAGSARISKEYRALTKEILKALRLRKAVILYGFKKNELWSPLPPVRCLSPL